MTGARDGVDPEKVQHKYVFGAALGDKMFTFEDKIVLLVLKNNSYKIDPCLGRNFSNVTMWNRVLGKNIQF